MIRPGDLPSLRELILGLLGLTLISCSPMSSPAAPPPPPWTALFQPTIYTSPEGKSLPYRLLVPDHIDPSRKYPVILFLHGAGENGNDNIAQLTYGVGAFAGDAHRAAYPCFVIAPQCPKDQQWVDTDWDTQDISRPKKASSSMLLALDILQSQLKTPNVDPDRVYLAGLSLGGFGVWDCLTRSPGTYAAAIIVCGGGDPTTVTPQVARVPVWVFHSKDDPVVPFHFSVDMINAERAAGGHPRFTIYNGLGHQSWDKAFADPELLPWLFAQKRGLPNPPPTP